MKDASFFAAAVLAGFYEAHRLTENRAVSAVDHVVETTRQAVEGAEDFYFIVAGHGPQLQRLHELSQSMLQDAPGVFTYEVAEDFGKWLYEMLADGMLPTEDSRETHLADLAHDFMIRGSGTLLDRILKTMRETPQYHG